MMLSHEEISGTVVLEIRALWWPTKISGRGGGSFSIAVHGGARIFTGTALKTAGLHGITLFLTVAYLIGDHQSICDPSVHNEFHVGKIQYGVYDTIG